jgi:hypothetical protein
MKELPRPPPAIVMTLRFWQEVVEPQQSEWRGEIKNLATGEVRYFRGCGDIAEIVSTMLSNTRLPGTRPP